jgi:hypothetical protein
VANIRDIPSFLNPDTHVYIARPSKWGNPFGVDSKRRKPALKSRETDCSFTREEAIAKYREWILGRPTLLAALSELEGKVLVCWCFPKPCHGDVLVELFEKMSRGEKLC